MNPMDFCSIIDVLADKLATRLENAALREKQGGRRLLTVVRLDERVYLDRHDIDRPIEEAKRAA